MEKITKFLVKIVKKASLLVNSKMQIRAKGSEGDLVTNFDYAIEKFLIGKIKKKFPDFDIVSEEFNSDNKASQNCFIIDPIDGTINFAHKLPFWGIQVACQKDGEMISAVIYIPELKRMYYADEKGAFLNGKKIKVSSLPLKNSLYAVEGKDRKLVIDKMVKYENNLRIIYSCALYYPFIAEGLLGGMLFRKDTPWDYAPGMYIVKQAGGYVYSKGSVHIAGNTKEMLNKLKKISNEIDKEKKALLQ